MATFNTTLQLDEPVEVVQARIVASVTAALATSQYQVSVQPGLIVLIRRYRPGWATVLAILGLLLFLLGLLFLLVKYTETLTISISPRGEGGCTVVVAGQATDWMILRVQAALTGAPVQAASPTRSREQIVKDAKLRRLKP